MVEFLIAVLVTFTLVSINRPPEGYGPPQGCHENAEQHSPLCGGGHAYVTRKTSK